MQVQDGETYILFVNNYSATNSGFTINFTGSIYDSNPTGVLNCDVPCDVTLGGDFELCPGTTKNIFAYVTGDIDNNENIYEWTRGTEVLSETGNTIVADQPGVYSVKVLNNDCLNEPTDTITVTSPSPLPITPAPDIALCVTSLSPPYTFDISQNTPIILNGLNPAFYPVTYYATSYQDAINGYDDGIIPAAQLSAYTAQPNTPIYARVEDYNTGCATVTTFELVVSLEPTATAPSNQQKCDVDNSGDEIFDLTEEEDVILGGQSSTDYVVTYHTTQAGATSNPAADVIPTPETFNGANQTIYVRVSGASAPSCYATTSFEISIIPTPQVVVPANEEVCDSFELQPLTVGNYYDQPAGQGNMLPAGTIITATQDIYVYAESGTTPNCTSEGSFTVTINQTPVADNIADITVCDSYELQPLSAGNTYHTAPGGAGTVLPAGTVITATQDIYIYAETGTTPNCTDESMFTVTIVPLPVADTMPNVTMCDSYELQPLSAGNTYHTAPGGAGTILAPGTFITSTQDIYIFAETGTTPNCTDESMFTVTILPIPVADNPADVTMCDSYELPPLNPGNTYHTAPGGAGTVLPAGTIITSTQDIYIFAETATTPNCTDENMFTVTILPLPVADTPANVTMCESYELPALSAGNVYRTAPGGAGTLLPVGTIITTTQDIYIYAETGTTPNCTDESMFTVTILPVPVAVTPGNQVACESYTLPVLATGDYYTGPGATGTLLSAGDVITTTQALYVYAQTGTTPNCTDEESFTVTIENAPVLVAATPIHECDDDFNGQAVFNLGPAGAEVTAGMAGYDITYYEDLTDAQQGNGNNITGFTAWSNTQPDTQTVYIRVVAQSGQTDCYSIATVDVIVDPRPAEVTLAPYELCDNNGSPDGREEFDLTTLTPDIINGAAGVSVHYYEDLADAQLGNGNFITTESAYDSASAQIWAVAENLEGCLTVIPVQLTVHPLPVIDQSMDPYYACEEVPGQGEFDLSTMDSLVTLGAPGYEVTYYDNQADALNGTGTPLPQNYITGDRVIYIRVRNTTTGCSIVTPLQLLVIPGPVAPAQAPLEECDRDLNQVATFNLVPVMNQISTSLGNVTLTAYETYDDAFYDAVNNRITNPGSYSNVEASTTNGVQAIYLRVQSNLTECFDIVELQLIVVPAPVATAPAQPYALCDNGPDDTDGIGIFNLTSRESGVLGSLSPAQYTVSYHQSQTDAEDNLGAIGNPGSYSSTGETIYIRVTSNATGCFDVVELELIVNPLPVVSNPAPITQCDTDNPGDEREEFDLTQRVDAITGGADGMEVTFHHDYNDAQLGIGEISNPEAYQNQSTVETLFVRVTNESTGCYRVVLMDIRVEPVPVLQPVDPALTTVCAPDDSGFGEFDLNAMLDDLINNAVNLQVTFHETYENAQDGQLPITNPGSYTNVLEYQQNIYVRAVNTVTGCSSAVPFVITLRVEPSPNPADLDPMILCDEDPGNDQDGKTYFDLTEQDNTLDPGGVNGYSITYYTSQANAQAGTPKILNAQNYYGADGQEIWVRVESAVTGCFNITSFELEVNSPLALTRPTAYVVCDDALPNDARAEFDLTTKNNEILGPGGVGLGYTVTYFESLSDRNANIPIADPEHYTNPAGQNPKTLQVMVTTDKGCRSYTTLTIKVSPLPTPEFNPAPLEECDDDTDGQARFDLTDAEAEIRDNDTAAVVTYHASLSNAEQGIADIGDPTDYLSGNATVYVRVEAGNSNLSEPRCYQIVELELIVNPLPVVGDGTAIAPYAICEPNTDGRAEFMLNQHDSQVITTGDEADYIIRYYLTQANAQAGTPALPNNYTNATLDQQTIWVRVTHRTTECVTIASFDLLVEEAAIATAIADQQVCDDLDGSNDGVATYDLTQHNAEILNGQPEGPGQFTVSYYDQDPSTAGATAIANPDSYRNDSAPELVTIYAVVRNEGTVSKCSDVTSFALIVEKLPVPQLEDGTICVDYTTGEVLRSYTLDSGLSAASHSFVWYQDGAVIPGATGATYEATTPGSYTVEATSATGCVSEPVAPVTVTQSGPAVAIGAGYTVSNAFSDNQTITISVEGYGEYQYSLDGGPLQDSPVFTNVTAGTHTVTVRDNATDDACTGAGFDLVIDNVSVIDYPNFFTPNGDGYHDTWNIVGLGSQGDALIYIFDRHGKLIKQISTQGQGWDGTYNGRPMPGDDYWFTVTYREEVTRMEPVRDADGDIIKDPVTGEDVTTPVTQSVQKEFKAHFALKR
jgi:gliding motility-associated-like protein